MRVVWSPLAIRRAREAADFIAQDRPTAATEWVSGLFDATNTLSRFPNRGRRVPELDRPDIRELIYGTYRVIYRVEPKRVSILTLRHARRRFDAAEVERA
ncbi:MAG: type II toxin-antitoxin system RelE/ParE family toxin [bacterium]